jgi:hypothetical protein
MESITLTAYSVFPIFKLKDTLIYFNKQAHVFRREK